MSFECNFMCHLKMMYQYIFLFINQPLYFSIYFKQDIKIYANLDYKFNFNPEAHEFYFILN